MAELNLYYNKQSNTWWINKDISGFEFKEFIKENAFGIGTVEFQENKSPIKNLYELNHHFVPNHIKSFNNVSLDIQENGFKNAIKVNKDELKEILEEYNLIK